MPRLLSIHPNYLPQVKAAWKRKRSSRRDEDLAQELGLPLPTVNLFLIGKPINGLNFLEICEALELNWREVAGLEVEENHYITRIEGKSDVDKALYDLVNTLCEMLRRLTRKAGDLLGADRTSIFLLDQKSQLLGTISAEDGCGGSLKIDLPASRGIAGLAAMTEEIINIPYDLYDDPRSKEAKRTDKRTGYRTYSMLAWPIFNQQRDLVAVVQLINKLKPNSNPDDRLSKRIDPRGFTKDDEILFAKFAPSILKNLERCQFCYQLAQKLRENVVIDQGGTVLDKNELIAQLKRREQQLRRSFEKI